MTVCTTGRKGGVAVARIRRVSMLVLVLAVMLLWAQSAAALSYFPAGPSGAVGVSRPRIAQRLVLDAGESITSAEMWLDGRQVVPFWDETGLVYYEPSEPLAPGEHQVRLVVRVSPGQRGYVYAPLESRISFTVSADAVASLPGPTTEELRALAEVNRYRQAAGVAPLTYDPRLAAAAAAQARYLVENPAQVDVNGHAQTPGGKGFIAETVGGRARYFTYDGGSTEVINFVRRAEDAVSGWMDTLYHRVPLIQPGMTVMGYGVASGGELTVNAAQLGPNYAASGLVRWPPAGQVGVQPQWDGLETPNPFAIYPQVQGPVGYPITLTFGERTRQLRLTEWSLTGPEGSVPLLPYDPARDPNLKDDDTVAVIPEAPLRPGARYTVRLAGQVDLGKGIAPFAETWSFTTAAEPLPVLARRVVNYNSATRNVFSIRLEGEYFPAGVRVYLDGLPVEALVRTSDRQLVFEPPKGYRGGRADLLLVTPGGSEVDWPDFFTGQEGYRFGQSAALGQVPLIVRNRPLSAPALVQGDGGTVLLPEAALEGLGASAERVSAIGRTYWSLPGGAVGEYTLGRVSASVSSASGQGTALRLSLPAQQRLGQGYVDAAFAQRLAGVDLQLVDDVLYLARRVGGQIDVDGHWAEAEIAELLEAGVVGGYGDGTFRPNTTLSRAAFVKMLAGAMGLAAQPGAAAGFADTAGHWVAREGQLGAAVAAGIVRVDEYPQGRFEPDRAISREEMAVMLVRALGLEEEALAVRLDVVNGQANVGGRLFRDADSWRRPQHVAAAIRAGLITGYRESDEQFSFRPEQTATRAEAAAMVVRAIRSTQ